ncbi:hypothetical protein EDD11_007731 [Mortierella claussenii]|nr:hypothetical protein EDD11_007731 [Mortierella claussenii]
MKISISTLILSLTAASAIHAVPTRLEKRDWVADKLKPLFTKAVKSLECGACVAALVGAKDVAILNKSWVISAAKELCPTLAKQPADVCNGMLDLYGPSLIDSVLKANILSGDGKLICYALGSICPAPAVTSGTLTFPKPRPANPLAPTHSGELVDVAHLSDWHVDELYVPGSESECGKPTCCRKFADSSLNLTRAAATWGDYNCDTPVKLTQDLLKTIPKVAHPTFVIMTGDIPPHDVWLETKDTVLPIEDHAYSAMAALPAKIYPAVGNHEAGPSNLFPTPASGGDASWLYNSLADNWSRWLPADAVNSVKNYGAYTVSPQPGFRIISLNTNFCYINNFHLYANTRDFDPLGEIKWLVQQLQAAEDAGERVWIIGHVSPSMTDCLQNWSALYYQAIQRYSPHVIAEQFFGHSHRDEFALYYASATKNPQTAISTAWIGPSVTPFTKLNPGFRIYRVDTKSWNIFDSQTYIADLDQAAKWDASGATPNWHLEYSARQAYGAFVPIADSQPLSASWWHNVTTVFEKSDAAFQQYWTFRAKSAVNQTACAAGSTCQTELICNLRAGKSSDACGRTNNRGKKRSIVIDQAQEQEEEEEDDEATDVSGMDSLYKRTEPEAWNKNLCGLSGL